MKKLLKQSIILIYRSNSHFDNIDEAKFIEWTYCFYTNSKRCVCFPPIIFVYGLLSLKDILIV